MKVGGLEVCRCITIKCDGTSCFSVARKTAQELSMLREYTVEQNAGERKQLQNSFQSLPSFCRDCTPYRD